MQRQKIDKIWFAVMVSFLTLMILCPGMLFAQGGSPVGQFVPVPNVVGMPISKASPVLAQSGLNPKGTASLPTGVQSQHDIIAYQSPPAGTQISRGQMVQLVLFNYDPRLQMVTVPSLAGMPMDKAGPALSQSGLSPQVMGNILTGVQNQNGTVAFQNPPTGTQINRGQAVQLVLFQFDPKFQMITVPNVVGMPMGQVASILNQARITFRSIGTQPTGIQNQNATVASQSPTAGTQISQGQIVDLVVFQYDPRIRPFQVVGSANISSFSAGQIALNPNTNRIYLGGGFAWSAPNIGIIAIDFSRVSNPVVAKVSPTGSGITANPAKNLFYSSIGGNSPSITEFDDVNYAIKKKSGPSTGCCGAFAFNQRSGVLYMTTQCQDTLHRYDPASNSITRRVGLGMVGSNVFVNDATGRVYTHNGSGQGFKVWNGTDLSLVATFQQGSFKGANPVTNELYVDMGNAIQIWDGTTHALKRTINGAGGSACITADTSTNMIFVTNGSNIIKIYDAAKAILLDTITLSKGYSARGIVTAGRGRLYVEGSPAGSNTIVYALQQ